MKLVRGVILANSTALQLSTVRHPRYLFFSRPISFAPKFFGYDTESEVRPGDRKEGDEYARRIRPQGSRGQAF